MLVVVYFYVITNRRYWNLKADALDLSVWRTL